MKEFPYEVKFTDMTIEQTHICLDWCSKYFGDYCDFDNQRWDWTYEKDAIDVFFFASEADKILFALRWA
jgi:hypothetical protein